MSLLLRLYYEFFKTGLFSIGGGLATLPFLYEMSANTGWFTIDDISNMVAISESTPGPLGVNMATYTGFTVAGIPGGIVAVLGLITPSLIIIMIISNILEKFKDNKYVQYAMVGFRAASVGLISVAGLQVARVAFLASDFSFSAENFFAQINFLAILLGVVLFIVYKKTNRHPIFYILAAGVMGVVLAL